MARSNGGNGTNAPPQGLNILQWNCRAVTGKVPFLHSFLKERPQTDVLMLQSLNVGVKSLPHLPGFYYPPVVATEKGRVMVATYVSTRLTYSNSDSVLNANPAGGSRLFISSVALPMAGGLGDVGLVNVYYPDGITEGADVTWLKHLVTPQSQFKRWVVAGDFNVSHRSWDPVTAPDQGVILAQAIMDSNLNVLNDGSVTRIGYDRQRNSAIDLTLASPNLSLDATWETGDDNMQSDHLPILVTLGQVQPALAEVASSPKFDFDKADWDEFRNLLDRECEDSDPRDPDLDTYHENIRGMILKAARATIPIRTPRKATDIRRIATMWWSSECDEATAEKRRATRRFKRNLTVENRDLLHAATKRCKEVAEKAKQEHWERFCTEEIREPKDSGKLWKKLRVYRRRGRLPEKALLVNGRKTETAKEKADALAETFAKASQTEHLPPEMRDYRRSEEPKFEHGTSDNQAPYNTDFALGELRTAIGSLGSQAKATGHDPISYQMIRRFPESMTKVLLDFFQKCWDSGQIPSAWKEAVVVAIPKAGKPPQAPSSYRPIALTAHLGKVYERLVKNRLEYHLEKHGIIPRCQAGFRKGRRCMEHVARLTGDVKKAMTNKHSVLATFFDIKRAFDTVWHAKLLDKLSKIGVAGRLHRFIQTFLEGRKITVRVGDSLSDEHILDMGVPQGSVIAPTLFSIMLHDIEAKVGNPRISMSLYADDLAIWLRVPTQKGGPRLDGLILRYQAEFQKCIDDIQGYMEHNGFELSPEKTALMVFARNGVVRQTVSIRIRDVTIKPCKEAKFLGVTLHQSLSWRTHTQSLRAKAMRAVNAIKMLTGESWITPKSLVHLTSALVRSRLTYGCEAFVTLMDTEWAELERAERVALRLAVGAGQNARNELIYQEVGWLPLREECQRRCANFQTAMLATETTFGKELVDNATPESLIREKLRDRVPRVHTRVTPVTESTKELWRVSGVQPQEVAQAPKQVFPPWELAMPRFECRYAEGSSKKSDPRFATVLAREKIERQFSQHLKVYTDGSLLDSGEVGCAFVIPDLGITKEFKLNAGLSIFSAEMFAILMACEFINDMPNTPRGVVILSDSKSSLQALERGGSRNRSDVQANILHVAHQIITKGSDLALMWLPSHCGIRGNELADCAARSAIDTGTAAKLPLTLSEITSKVGKAARTIRDRRLRKLCKEKGWIYLEGNHSHVPTMPRRHIGILSRIRTLSWRCVWNGALCECGDSPSIHHVVKGCDRLPQTLRSVWELRDSHALGTADFLRPHPTLGVEPMRVLLNAIISSNLTKWF